MNNEEIVNTIEANSNNKKNPFVKVGVIILIILIIGVLAVLLFNSLGSKDDKAAYRITKGGSYDISGEYGCIIINTKSEVTLNLEGAKITCSTGPAINVKTSGTVNIVLTGDNSLISTTTKDLDGAIYSKGDLVLSGLGKLTITSNYDGIVSKDGLRIKNGTYNINAEDDGIRGKNNVIIESGVFTLNVSGDGIKATNDTDKELGYIEIKEGVFDIVTGSDAIQAEAYINISGGVYTIETGGGYKSVPLDDEKAAGLKATNNVVINDGVFTFDNTGDSIHSDGTLEIKGGTLVIKTNDDGIHADSTLNISGGDINIINCYEGLEGSTITISGGNISIVALNDGVNAVGTKASERQKMSTGNGQVVISDGTLKIVSEGDAIDCNGTIEIKGGTIYAESLNLGGETALDHDKTLTVSGGTVIAVSKSSGSPDIGERTSTQPMLIANISNSSGTITLGDISYEPTISDYVQVIISSPSLSEGRYRLTYGKNSQIVTLTDGVVTIGKSSIEWEEVGRGTVIQKEF